MKKFRVHVRYTTLYYLVRVWDNKKDFIDYRCEQDDKESDKDCEAYVDPYDVYKVGKKKKGKSQAVRKLPILGEINFHKDRLGSEVISHESVHAIIHYMRRRNKSFSALDENKSGKYMEFEEDFAYTVGRFNRDLVSKLYKYKLYD